MWKRGRRKVRDRETRSPARETHALPFIAQAQNQLSAIGYPLLAFPYRHGRGRGVGRGLGVGALLGPSMY